MNNTWIQIYRKIDEWEWRDNPYMFSIFMWLLTHANIEDKKYHGIVIKRGQFLTSKLTMSEVLGMDRKTLRGCLKKLEDSKEITQEVSSKNTLITLCNYEKYNNNHSLVCGEISPATSPYKENDKSLCGEISPATSPQLKNIDSNNINKLINNTIVVDVVNARASEKKIANKEETQSDSENKTQPNLNTQPTKKEKEKSCGKKKNTAVLSHENSKEDKLHQTENKISLEGKNWAKNGDVLNLKGMVRDVKNEFPYKTVAIDHQDYSLRLYDTLKYIAYSDNWQDFLKIKGVTIKQNRQWMHEFYNKEKMIQQHSVCFNDIDLLHRITAHLCNYINKKLEILQKQEQMQKTKKTQTIYERMYDKLEEQGIKL